MKKVFLSILAVAALASCVQSEDVGFNNPIDFGAPFVGNTTKAADPSYGAGAVQLTEFKVYGTVQGTGAGVVNIFNGDRVYGGTIGTTGVWQCDKTQYWIEGATYNFAAVADATVTPDTGMPAKLTTVALTNDDPAKRYLKDMLYDQPAEFKAAKNAENTYAPVNFAFKHLLAKAQFVVTSNTVDGYYYNVKDIKIHNYASGTYTIAAKTWDDLTTVAYSLGNIEKITYANTLGNTEGDKFMTNKTQVLLIPTATDFQVEFIVELWNDNGAADDVLLREIHYTTTALPAGSKAEKKDPIKVTTDLQNGFAYNFNIKLEVGSPIQFTVEKQPTWTDDTMGNFVLE
jgi:hypothetical protein